MMVNILKQKSLFSIFNKNKNKIEASDTRDLDSSIELNILDAKEYLKRGVAKFKLKKYGEALIDLNKSIEMNPNDLEAYIKRSKIKRELKDERGANQDLNDAKIILDKLENGFNAYDKAETNLDDGNYKEAIKNYNRAISLIPSLTDIYHNRGLAKRRIDDLDGAIEDFNKAIDSDASNKAFAYYNRGLIKFHKLKDPQGALEDYNKAIELQPTESDFYYSKAILSNDYEAVQYLTKAVELNPANAMIYFARAIRESILEDYTSVIKDFDKFIEINPSDAEFKLDATAYYYRGVAKIKQGQIEEGNFDINKAKQLGFDDYDEEASIEACQEVINKIREEVANEIEINGPRSKEEIEKEREDLYKQLIDEVNKSKEDK